MRLRIYDSLDRADRLASLVASYRTRTGRNPRRLEELVASGLWSGPLADVAGVAFDYDERHWSGLDRTALAHVAAGVSRRAARPASEDRMRSLVRCARRALLVVVATALAAPASAQVAAPAATPPSSPAKGDVVRAFETTTIDGQPQKVAFPKGSKTVLLFFLSGCPVCHKMIPEWNRAYERRPKQLRVIGVLMDQEPPGFWSAVSIQFPVLRAPGREFLRSLNVNRAPLTLRVGEGGTVEDLGLGADRPDQAGRAVPAVAVVALLRQTRTARSPVQGARADVTRSSAMTPGARRAGQQRSRPETAAQQIGEAVERAHARRLEAQGTPALGIRVAREAPRDGGVALEAVLVVGRERPPGIDAEPAAPRGAGSGRPARRAA